MTRAWTILFAATAVAAASAPVLSNEALLPRTQAMIAWPATYDGRAITPMRPAPEDALLARSFPGRTARFSDGSRQIVLRRLDAVTRRLHPARDCFRATGHVIAPAPMRVSATGDATSCFRASRGGRALLVCEQIRDGAGRSWPDISSWYWSALTSTSNGPWTAALTVERVS